MGCHGTYSSEALTVHWCVFVFENPCSTSTSLLTTSPISDNKSYDKEQRNGYKNQETFISIHL
jgi:hypothetical protein